MLSLIKRFKSFNPFKPSGDRPPKKLPHIPDEILIKILKHALQKPQGIILIPDRNLPSIGINHTLRGSIVDPSNSFLSGQLLSVSRLFHDEGLKILYEQPLSFHPTTGVYDLHRFLIIIGRDARNSLRDVEVCRDVRQDPYIHTAWPFSPYERFGAIIGELGGRQLEGLRRVRVTLRDGGHFDMSFLGSLVQQFETGRLEEFVMEVMCEGDPDMVMDMVLGNADESLDLDGVSYELEARYEDWLEDGWLNLIWKITKIDMSTEGPESLEEID